MGRLALVLAVLAALLGAPPARGGEGPASDRAKRREKLREAYGEKAEPLWWLVRAERKAAEVTAPDDQAAAFVVVARAWAEAQEPDRAKTALGRAEQAAVSLEASTGKVRRLLDAARAARDAGDAERASKDLDLAADAARALAGLARSGALADVGAAHGAAGEAEAAAPLFTEAGEVAASLDSYEKMDAYSALATAQAKGRDLPGAGRSVLAILAAAPADDPDAKGEARDIADEVRIAVVGRVAEQGDAKGALDLARALDRPLYKSRALLAVGARLGDGAETKKALQEAGQVAVRIQDPSASALVLASVAREAARRGAADVAKQAIPAAGRALGDILEPESQVEAMLSLAAAFAAAGDLPKAAQNLESARKTVDQHVPARQRDLALETVARGAAEAGVLGVARAVADEIADPEVRARVTIVVGDAAERAGDDLAALETARQLGRTLETWPDDLARARDQALGGMALLQTSAGRPDLAAASADRIQSPSFGAETYAKIARLLL